MTNVMFFCGGSSRSYMISSDCPSSAIAIAWARLEGTEGSRDGWSLVLVN